MPFLTGQKGDILKSVLLDKVIYHHLHARVTIREYTGKKIAVLLDHQHRPLKIVVQPLLKFVDLTIYLYRILQEYHRIKLFRHKKRENI